MLSILGKTWQARGTFDPDKSLLENFLAVRGFARTQFPAARFADLALPFAFRRMEQCAARIFHAIEHKERILLFGDYDADGISAVAQLFLTLQELGAEVSYRLPSRADGYGLSHGFVIEAAENDVRLLITADCGIADCERIALARAHGIDVIVTDHHTPPAELPDTPFVLHPLLPDETFPDREITGAGVAFFLCLALLTQRFGVEKSERFARQLLELAAIGTVADCGILLGQNRLITLLGLEALRSTNHPGLTALLTKAGIDPTELSAEAIGFYLAPRLNAAGRLEHPALALDLLCRNFGLAATAAERLHQLNAQRQDLVEELVAEAEAMLPSSKAEPAIVIARENWPSGVIGLIAGRLAEKYACPVVILSAGLEKYVASCRGPEDFHFAAILQELAAKNPKLFLSFGGHAAAAGFSILPQQFELFRETFRNEVIRVRGASPPPPTCRYDFDLESLLTPESLRELSMCEPFGMGNPLPSFVFPELTVRTAKAVGNAGKHLALTLRSATGQIFPAIFFGQGTLLNVLSVGKKCAVLAAPEVSEWQGRVEVKFKIQDLRFE